jgi:hypothetical protein
MNCLSCAMSVPGNVFVRRCAGRLYGECSIARRVIGSVGVGDKGNE